MRSCSGTRAPTCLWVISRSCRDGSHCCSSSTTTGWKPPCTGRYGRLFKVVAQPGQRGVDPPWRVVGERRSCCRHVRYVDPVGCPMGCNLARAPEHESLDPAAVAADAARGMLPVAFGGTWRWVMHAITAMPAASLIFVAVVSAGLVGAWSRGGTLWKGRLVKMSATLPPWRPYPRRRARREA